MAGAVPREATCAGLGVADDAAAGGNVDASQGLRNDPSPVSASWTVSKVVARNQALPLFRVGGRLKEIPVRSHSSWVL